MTALGGPRIRVVPSKQAGLEHTARVYRDSVQIGWFAIRSERYYPWFVRRRPETGPHGETTMRAFVEQGAFWYNNVTDMLRYILTGVPGDSARAIVSERGDGIAQRNAEPASVIAAGEALAEWRASGAAVAS